jgi:hypothetical protein
MQIESHRLVVFQVRIAEKAPLDFFAAKYPQDGRGGDALVDVMRHRVRFELGLFTFPRPLQPRLMPASGRRPKSEAQGQTADAGGQFEANLEAGPPSPARLKSGALMESGGSIHIGPEEIRQCGLGPPVHPAGVPSWTPAGPKPGLRLDQAAARGLSVLMRVSLSRYNIVGGINIVPTLLYHRDPCNPPRKKR